eukprot:6399833-Prymnesium_polylepis.1
MARISRIPSLCGTRAAACSQWDAAIRAGQTCVEAAVMNMPTCTTRAARTQAARSTHGPVILRCATAYADAWWAATSVMDCAGVWRAWPPGWSRTRLGCTARPGQQICWNRSQHPLDSLRGSLTGHRGLCCVAVRGARYQCQPRHVMALARRLCSCEADGPRRVDCLETSPRAQPCAGRGGVGLSRVSGLGQRDL